MLWYAVCVHTSWAVILLAGGESAVRATPIHTISGHAQWIGLSLPVLLLATSALATYGLTKAQSPYTRALCLIPQQGAVIATAGGAIAAVISGHYADGVMRPAAFILADQLPSILIAVFHTFAVFDLAGMLKWPLK